MRIRTGILALALGASGLLTTAVPTAAAGNVIAAQGAATLVITNPTASPPSFTFVPGSFHLAGVFVENGVAYAGALSQPSPTPTVTYNGNVLLGTGTISGGATFNAAAPNAGGTITLVLNSTNFTYVAGVFIATFNFSLSVGGQGFVTVDATTVFSGVPVGAGPGLPPGSVTVQVVGTSEGVS